MNFNKKLFLVLLLLTNLFFLKSQDITFSKLSTQDGLSHVSVITMYEDEMGFIWAGTREGINMYNGNTIKVFRQEKDNPNSLFSNFIKLIVGDKNGKIYFLTKDGGVGSYDYKADKFTNLNQSLVSSITYSDKLYFSRGNEIFVKEDNLNSFQSYLKLPDSKAQISCFSIINGTVWIGTTNSGLYTYNKKEGYRLQQPKHNISCIYKDNSNTIWVGTTDKGLIKYANKQWVNYLNNVGDPKSLSSNYIRTVCEDDLGDVWIGTFRGLCRFDKESSSFTTFEATDKNSGLSNSSIWSIIKDHQGTMWVGTYFGGINYFNPQYEIFTHSNVSKAEGLGLSSPIVGKMLEDKYNNLWICTEGGGLNMYNRKTNKFKWYKQSYSSKGISQNNIKSIYYDEATEVMWIGTHLGGLNKLDIRSGQFIHYSSIENDNTSLPSDIIHDIVPYNKNLIIATENGICLFNPLTGKSEQLFVSHKLGKYIKNVLDLMIDYEGVLWFSSEGQGVFSYRFDKKELNRFVHDSQNDKSISSNTINSIYQDKNKNLWFCTSGSGLDLFRRKDQSFENFDSNSNDISSDYIYQICEAQPNKYLVITNQGYSIFDYRKKIFHNYNSKNGFPLTAINENALYLSKDSTVFLGGVQGMISFRLKDMNFPQKPYEIYLSRLWVNGDEVKVNDNTNILSTSLFETKKITLNSNQRTFSLEFATSNFIPANKTSIVYKLDGFSDTWNNTRDLSTIRYTNLNSGKYTLIIKGENYQGKIIPEYRLEIEVLPPYYRTWLAYFIYLFIISWIIYYLLKINNNRIKLEESLKYEQKHIQDVETLNQAKLQFFTNISHEFRTPLTVIVGQMDILLNSNSYTPVVYNKLLSVYKNSIRLKELVTELLDFRKQEEGQMKISVTEHNLVEMLHENYVLFQEYANSRKLNFVFDKQSDVINAWYDAKQMQKVINNLLSNAFKHNEKGDTITLSVHQTNDDIIFSVADTGCGIDAQIIDKIFEVFYVIDKVKDVSFSSTGLGLALTRSIVELHRGKIEVSSELNVGATFTVTLKAGNEHFNSKQLESNRSTEFGKQVSDVVNVEAYQTKDLVFANSDSNDTYRNKILIVEDNESLREMLVEMFTPFYTVVSAIDGQDGLEKMKIELPNIVLSDVLMPRMSGIELCKEIKSDIDICHIPVVLLTARTAIEHNLEGLQNGADDYITKPFNSSVLIARCNNLLNSRALLLERFSNQYQTTPQMLATNVLDKNLLDKALEIIEAHIADESFNVNTFSREMGMSRTNLFSKIKGITGQTPNDFIVNIRLKKAAVLLQNNHELNITEISEQLGFNSARYFSKCFKNQFHVSPLSFRKGSTVEEDEDDE